MVSLKTKRSWSFERGWNVVSSTYQTGNQKTPRQVFNCAL